MRESAPWWRRHSGAAAGSAAAAVIVAFAVAIGIGHFRSDDNGGALTTASGADARKAAGIVTTSGADYTSKNLAGALPSLLAHQAPTVTALSGSEAQGSQGTAGGTGTGAGAASPPSKPSPGASLRSPARSTSEAPKVAADTAASLPATLTALKTDPAALAQCLTNLEASATPLAVDLGLWNGKPAAVFVFPSETTVDEVSVFVVAAGCPPGAFLYFGNLKKP
jgi:hypothetical protein